MREDNKLYAWVSKDGRGVEGIVQYAEDSWGDPRPVALVSHDLESLRRLRPEAMSVMAARGRPVRLVEYLRGETLEVLE